MIVALASISSWVWLVPGDRVKVVLMNNVRSPEKSTVVLLVGSLTGRT
jgi:hypothetical protein